MKTVAWPCPAPGGAIEEFALVCGPADAARRVLIAPALFDEANKTRRLLAETMRGLAARGVATVLPDLPGCGESLAPLDAQTLASWRAAMAAAAGHFAATHVLALRGGALVAPALPGWRLEPTAAVLRPLLRARTVAAREAGRTETIAELLEAGRREGLELAGYRLGPAMVGELEGAALDAVADHDAIGLEAIGGSALWLRAEPGEDPAMAAALAERLAR